MPKLKSKGAIKKRFKITKSGIAVVSRAGRGHFLAGKNGKQGRRLRKQLRLNSTWSKLIRPMMGA